MGINARNRGLSRGLSTEGRLQPWHYAAAFAAASLLALHAYGPALRGPFLFDDWTLPFNSPEYSAAPLSDWLIGVRPVLMFSYWLNHTFSPDSTLSYHLVNILLHAANAVLVFFILRRLLDAAPGRLNSVWAAAFGGALFLLHPLETEAVAYIAGRSEVLSALFFLAALALFIHWTGKPPLFAQAAILVLFAAGAATKEHIVAALPAALILATWLCPGFRSAESTRRMLRASLPVLIAGIAGGAYVWSIISAAPSAGPNLRDVTPLEYFYTSSRALFSYGRLFFFPVRQNFDTDFPVSQTPADHGAWIALTALALIVALAVYTRRRHPLIAFGLLLHLALLAPTSSFIPLADAFAEHRMYLPSVGLLVIITAAIAHCRVRASTLALVMSAVLVAAGALTHRRSQVWSDAIVFWKDVVAKSPRKARPYDHLVHSYARANRNRELVAELERADHRLPRDYYLLVNWATAYDRIQQPEKALAKLREAARLNASADVHALKGQILAKMGRRDEALDALQMAIAKEARGSDMAHLYRGYWLLIAQRVNAAINEFQLALELNPDNPDARNALSSLMASRASNGAPDPSAFSEPE